ncbi:hypothetical protein ACIO8G_37940 [Streptomyces sp. NPDC087219]
MALNAMPATVVAPKTIRQDKRGYVYLGTVTTAALTTWLRI